MRRRIGIGAVALAAVAAASVSTPASAQDAASDAAGSATATATTQAETRMCTHPEAIPWKVSGTGTSALYVSEPDPVRIGVTLCGCGGDGRAKAVFNFVTAGEKDLTQDVPRIEPGHCVTFAGRASRIDLTGTEDGRTATGVALFR